MNKKLLTMALTALCSIGAAAQSTDSCTVFIYSPGQSAGLHLAVGGDGSWRDVGQLCGSDYGTWGAEKRMYHPSVCRAADGSEVLIPGETVVCAVGQRANRADVDALRRCAPWVREIGDCIRPANITKAIYEGYHAALDV